MELFRKFNFLIISTFISLCLLSCSSGPVNHYYASPIITGQILDKTTNRPLKDVSISQTTETESVTDSQGYFKLPALKFSYRASEYDSNTLNMINEGSTYLYKEGYRVKSLWNFGLKTSEIKHTLEVPYHIHIGKVYLEPLPEGININDVDIDFIENLTFCQPNETQKKVNCMPIPDGVEYESL